ncbi:F5/8 type C domain protein [Cystobacter fuscus DSM 2262]|uniref:F5/8 type C domain protein n=1 Tax=Cystobacter fuscus (strain ATCC 25194 / DSM 2262 / NBRC 100088 / M29) TaxID=1242864 RepID=S9P4N2_CYSF2|nr:heparin lyase I family protein [Cystobacter fuscus]EPX58126.1 F5/8 type C domain protein [Cystobacter fuscus DSM 2262]
MKKTLLLVEALSVLAGVGCGLPDEQGEADEFFQTMGATADALSAPNCTTLSAASVLASGNDGNGPRNTLDDQMGTRWSNQGAGSWIDYDLGSTRTVSGAAIAWHQGNLRTNTFSMSVSLDGMSYTTVYSGTSSGKTTAAETYTFSARSARRLRITFKSNSQNDWASIAEARACGAASESSSGSGVVWRGDFDTGDRTQWTRTQMVSSDRLQVVSSPARQGSYAIKVTVKQGDNPISASGNRNELVKMTNEKEGDEYYYRWSTMFASDFPSAKTWQLFTQWHQSGDSGSPPVEFYVNGETIYLRLQGSTVVWSTPLVRGQWQDFIFHVKWSSKSGTGFVELYRNGKLELPKRYIATMYSGQTNYLKVGLYRNSTIAPTGVVYHDGWVQGRSLQDVQ